MLEELHVLVHQAPLVFELVLDAIEQLTGVDVDPENRGEQHCRSGECVSLPFLVGVCDP